MLRRSSDSQGRDKEFRETPHSRVDRGQACLRVRTKGKRQRTLKGIVRHRETGKYYQGRGRWTSDADRAMDFESLSEVVEESGTYGIKDCCEYILKVEGLPDFSVFRPL